jgi:aspartyl-tRNA(Asn)/glutamyl-tRNA(Gln) amidotransferase subunit A
MLEVMAGAHCVITGALTVRARAIEWAPGRSLSAGDYVDAQRVRRLAARRLANTFDEVDLIVTPTAGRSAPLISEIDGQSGAMVLAFPL